MNRSGMVLSVILGGLVLSGCAQRPQALTPMAQQTAISRQSEKSYSIGKSQKAYIGAPMVRVRQYAVKTADFAIPTASFVLTPPIGLGGFSATGGARYQIIGTALHNGETFYVIPLQPTGMMMAQGAALVRKNGSIYDHPLVSGGLIAPDRFTVEPFGARFEISEVKDFNSLGGDDNFELIYSGISGGNIRILYREYTGDNIARPAFSQELTYDRSSSTIRYRNLLMKLDKATNEEINFMVVSD